MALSMMRICVSGAGASCAAGICRNSVRAMVVSGRAHAYSTIKSSKRELAAEENVKKSVFISQSNDIFTNLALENWLYKNYDFSNHHVLMVWRNDPCVVIGRHQNPWQEANLSLLSNKSIELARRNSGGGTVYHDGGNLNLSFFCPRERYDRKYNLELIIRALNRGFGVEAEINSRQDIIVQGKYKISGTASKLGRLTAYHHCTLLVSSDKVELGEALARNREHGIQSKATESTRSPVANLCELNKSVSVDGLQVAIGSEYMRTPALHIEDGGYSQMSKQYGFQMVNPTDYYFPGITELRNELCSWDWCYGKTPEFTVSRTFPVPAQLLAPSKVYSAPQDLVISMVVDKGLIKDVTLNIPPGLIESGFHGEAQVVTNLKGRRFTADALNAVQSALQDTKEEGKKLGEREEFLAKCFDRVVNTM